MAWKPLNGYFGKHCRPRCLSSRVAVFAETKSIFRERNKIFFGITRDDQKVHRKKLPFWYRLINRVGITAHNTATHMQLIGYNMFDVSRLCALQLLSRQWYIARTGAFYIAFWRFTTQTIKLECFVKFCYAVIAHIVFHAYLMAYLLLFYINCQKAKHSTSMNPLPVLACQFYKINYLHTSKNNLFQDSRSYIES